MKSKLKKMLSMAVLSAMVVTSMAGCGSSGGDTDNSADGLTLPKISRLSPVKMVPVLVVHLLNCLV